MHSDSPRTNELGDCNNCESSFDIELLKDGCERADASTEEN